MSTANPNVTDLIEPFIHLVDDVQKLFRDLSWPTQVELNNLWNNSQENTTNSPNSTCIGGAIELTICITNRLKWLSSELGCIIQDQLEVAEAAQEANNAKAVAETLPRVPHK